MIRRAMASVGLVVLAMSFHPASAAGQEKLFQLSFIGPTIQLVDDDSDIKGVRLSLIYGLNRNVTGLDFGLISHTTGDSKGLQLGLVGLTDGTFRGWQNSLANVARDQFYGFQHGFVNVMGAGEGVQLGWGFNRAERMNGLQISLVNFAEDLDGIQIGLVNIIRSKDRFPILPIVNWKFQ